MKTVITLLIAGGALTYSLAVILAWHKIEDDSDWAWWKKLGWALFHAFAVIRDWILDAVVWATPRAARASVRHTRKAHRGWRSMQASYRRRRADRRRPAGPAGERRGNVPGPGVARVTAQQPAAAPQAMRQEPRTGWGARPLHREPLQPPGPPIGAPSPPPAAANGPAPGWPGDGPGHRGGSPFQGLIDWVASLDPEDSDEFELNLKEIVDGFLGMGDAFESFAEHCAEGGIGLDPMIVSAVLDLANAVSSNGEWGVNVKKKLDAVYAGFREWAQTHRPTKNGRWVRPESAA